MERWKVPLKARQKDWGGDRVRVGGKSFSASVFPLCKMECCRRRTNGQLGMTEGKGRGNGSQMPRWALLFTTAWNLLNGGGEMYTCGIFLAVGNIKIVYTQITRL